MRVSCWARRRPCQRRPRAPGKATVTADALENRIGNYSARASRAGLRERRVERDAQLREPCVDVLEMNAQRAAPPLDEHRKIAARLRGLDDPKL